MANIQPRLTAILLLVAAVPALAWETLTPDLHIECKQPAPLVMECSYRPLLRGAPSGIEAEVAGQALAINDAKIYPWPGAASAILLLIDTSDPGRQQVVENNIGQVIEALKAAKSHHRFGLASFDQALRVEAPLGSPPDRIETAARGLKATGMTTELYRSLLQAIDLLSQFPAERRAIMVFSDGQAEDQAYFHQDVVRAARRAGVIIHSLGFPRSVARSVALQTLRRLSEESGGTYVESDQDFNLPTAFANALYGAVDAGGRFSVDLSALRKAAAGAQEILLTFALSGGDVQVSVPLAGPPAPPAQAVATAPPGQAVQAAPAPAPEVRIVAAVPPPRSDLDLWLWYGIPIALMVLIILALGTLMLTYRKPGMGPRALSMPAPDRKPLAYLIAQDEKKTRYPITRSLWRIGRSRDNELTLHDSSVSRRHAEIQRTGDGKFVLIDRDSTNGVFVNNEKIGRRELQDGDIIEIGDIYLRFSESPADYPLAESTAMLNTRAPRV